MCFFFPQDIERFNTVIESHKGFVDKILDIYEVDKQRALTEFREFTIEHNIHIGMLNHRNYLREQLEKRQNGNK